MLFDELHSFWLIDLLKTLCASFATAVESDKTVILLDNSPGYVGLGRAIHDWLTDIGPQRGKFLTVSSLDIQDLSSCLSAIRSINKMLEEKIEGATHYHQLKKYPNNSTPPLSGLSDRFFMKLAGTGVDAEDYAYFHEDIPRPYPLSSYQTLIINKAPTAIKAGNLFYDINAVLSEDRDSKRILTTFSGPRLNSNSRNIIFFDNHLHFQFIEPFIKKIDSNKGRKYTALKSRFTRIRKEIRRNQLEPQTDYHDFINAIENYERLLNRLLFNLTHTGFGLVAQLVEERWHPRAPLAEIMQAFETFIDDSLSMKHLSFSERSGSSYEYAGYEIEEREIVYIVNALQQLFERYVPAPFILPDYRFHFVAIVYYLAKEYVYPTWRITGRNNPFEALSILLACFQGYRYNQNKKDSGSFLATENADRSDWETYARFAESRWQRDSLYGKHISDLLRDPDALAPLYNTFCHVQARLLNTHKDFDFLVSVLRDVTVDNMEQHTILPDIGGLLDEVIVHKTLRHAEASPRLKESKRDASYLTAFRDALTQNVISKWKL